MSRHAPLALNRDSHSRACRDDQAPVRRPRVWVVRADRGRYVDHFVSGGYAGIGQSVNLATVKDTEDIRTRYEDENPDASAHQVGAAISQLESFLQIETGDYVIAPETDTRWLRYGRVKGPCYFASADDGCPYQNRRPVEWESLPLARHRFSESLQNTLGALKTVFAVGQRDEFLNAASQRPKTTGCSAKPATQEAVATRRSTPQGQPWASTRDETGEATGYRRTPPDDTSKAEEEEGVETEQEDSDAAHIDSPFDPSSIRVRTIPVLVEQLVSRIRHDEIDLAPDFQRLRGIWKPADKSRLIESLLLRIPIPVFYVAADERDEWRVVDGVQRISTMFDYVDGQFPLQRLQYLGHFADKRYEELPRPMQRRINETQLTVNVIEPGTPEEVMFNIFHRINTGGLDLNGQEIRHALNPGPIRDYLIDLAKSEEFLIATNRKVSPRRMADRECVLRFLAFRIEPWEQYSTASLDAHLGAAMRRINKATPERRAALAADFRRAMHTASEIFGKYAFRKRYGVDEGRLRPINKALLESWSVQLARCSSDENDRLIELRDEVQARSIALLNDDPEFEKAISLSTGTAQRIRKRFASVQLLVEDVLS